MKAHIINHRGIVSAEIDIGELTILAGPNGSGKTSICQAIGGLVSGEPNIYGLTKKDLPLTIRTGQKSGTISINDGESGLTVEIPGGKIQSFGSQPPQASAFAVGLKTFARLTPKERIDLIRELYHAEPTKEQLFAAIKVTGAPDDKIEKLWQTIQSLGWDTALKQAQDKGRELKGQWDYVTKEKYGSQKAEGWKPAGWEAALDRATEAGLKENISEAQGWLESGLKAEAQASVETDNLKALAGTVKDLKRQAMRSDDEYKARQKAYIDISVKDKGYTSEPQECPHCGKPLIISSGAICKATTTKAAAKRDLEAWQALRKQIEAALTAKEQAYSEAESLKRQLKAATDAAAKLAELESAPEQAAIDIEEAHIKLALAQNWLELWNKKREADRIHELIKLNAVIQETLSPEGLRAKALKEALDIMNAVLAEMCGLAKWNVTAIEVDADMAIRATKRERVATFNVPYLMLSESEQLFVDYVFQLCIAARQEADLIILDRVSNINDRDGRNGIMRLVRETGIQALVAFAMNDTAEVPARARDGYAAYWIDEGSAVKLDGAAVEA